MRSRLTAWIVVVGVMTLLVGPAPAQEAKAPATQPAKAPAKEPDAILLLSEGSVALGIGWTWGHGELKYQGKAYKVKVDGLSLGDVSVTKMKAMGKVSNLKALDDFSGTYKAVATGATVGMGVGIAKLENDKGVEIEIKNENEGVGIKVAVEGLKLKLENLEK
jgi:hypothetical protein